MDRQAGVEALRGFAGFGEIGTYGERCAALVFWGISLCGGALGFNILHAPNTPGTRQIVDLCGRRIGEVAESTWPKVEPPRGCGNYHQPPLGNGPRRPECG